VRTVLKCECRRSQEADDGSRRECESEFYMIIVIVELLAPRSYAPVLVDYRGVWE
jgi:hypothetical protein